MKAKFFVNVTFHGDSWWQQLLSSTTEKKSIESSSKRNILVSIEAKYFFKKGKLIYIEKSTRWAQPGFCSFKRLEMTSKTMKTFIETKSLMNYQIWLCFTKWINSRNHLAKIRLRFLFIKKITKSRKIMKMMNLMIFLLITPMNSKVLLNFFPR